MSSSLGVQCALQINPLGVNKVEIIKIILRKLNMPMERKKEKYLIIYSTSWFPSGLKY